MSGFDQLPLQRMVRPLLRRKRSDDRVDEANPCLFLDLHQELRTRGSCPRNPVRCTRRSQSARPGRCPSRRHPCGAAGAPDSPALPRRQKFSGNREESSLRWVAIPPRSLCLLLEWAQSSEYPVQLHELFNRHGLRALQHLSGALVRLAHLALLIIGQRHDPQRENFVNLGSVKQISCAFGRNQGIVVENDRRGEHGVALSFLSNKNRPGSHVRTTRGQLAHLLRRREQRDKPSILQAEDGMSRDQGLYQSIFTPGPVRALKGCGVANAHAHFRNATILPRPGKFDFPQKVISFTYKNRDDPTVGLSECLKLFSGGKSKGLGYRTLTEGCNIAQRRHNFPLHRFLPGLVDAASHREFVHQPKFRYFTRQQFVYRRGQLADRARHQLQKSHSNFKPGQRTALHQTFGLHGPGLAAVLRFAVRLRTEHPEVPALLILHRRWAVGIEHVSLVQYRFRDLVHRREIHSITFSSTGSMLSSTSSQVGMPCWILY